MTTRLRIHRGDGAAERVVTLNDQVLGPLAEEINDFVIASGHHVLNTRLDIYRGKARTINAKDDEVLEFIVLADSDAVLPVLQGGFVSLEPVGAVDPHRFVPADLREVAPADGLS